MAGKSAARSSRALDRWARLVGSLSHGDDAEPGRGGSPQPQQSPPPPPEQQQQPPPPARGAEFAAAARVKMAGVADAAAAATGSAAAEGGRRGAPSAEHALLQPDGEKRRSSCTGAEPRARQPSPARPPRSPSPAPPPPSPAHQPHRAETLGFYESDRLRHLKQRSGPADLSLLRFINAELTRGYFLEHNEAKYTERRERVYTCLRIPRELEKANEKKPSRSPRGSLDRASADPSRNGVVIRKRAKFLGVDVDKTPSDADRPLKRAGSASRSDTSTPAKRPKEVEEASSEPKKRKKTDKQKHAESASRSVPKSPSIPKELLVPPLKLLASPRRQQSPPRLQSMSTQIAISSDSDHDLDPAQRSVRGESPLEVQAEQRSPQDRAGGVKRDRSRSPRRVSPLVLRRESVPKDRSGSSHRDRSWSP
ncbi:serine/arginine repetitive matrix protein 1-like [Heteronotia binoei]|uniref:serine/arginine repetitive matrix protein 1-like n=1 Tax=Heteronotia binoei TaxID=13085 RepID=UPI00292F64BA|nr:serine/arginine repetitive matrix protein 1-like [Heteronotia binoei]